jgi:cation:H+ antiporter
VVAFGTSTPELAVSVTAAFAASTDMALANVVGSNIANIALVLGLAAIVRPLHVERALLRREIPAAAALQLLVPLMLLDGAIGRVDGLVLVACGVGYNLWLIAEVMRGVRPPEAADEELGTSRGLFVDAVTVVLGLVVLLGGSHLFVDGAVEAAGLLGLSDRYIGLTVVALGTSAPEVATSVVSAARGKVDLAVGNAVGSNLVNATYVLGLTAVVMPVSISESRAWLDLAVAFGVTLLLVPLVLRPGGVRRPEGAALALLYVLYILLLAR